MISAPSLALLTDDELAAAYGAELSALGILDEAMAVEVLDLETASLLEEWSRIQVEYPLADAVLWQLDDEPWDQRRLVASLVHPLTLVLGGNRGGKTYAILEALVAFALGGDHPAVICWLEVNDLPRDLIPPGPGECYAVAPSAASSIKIHRLDIDDLLPASKHWRSQHASAEASVEIAVPGYETPARIWFKSGDQGHRAFKGDQVRFVAISEELEGEEGQLVLAECMRACAATGGRVVLEMTPQNGMTWVYDRLVVGDPATGPDYGCVTVTLDSSHNVMVQDYASLQRWLASMSDDERRMRQKGEFVDRRGLVYTGWSRGDGDRWGPGHLCTPFEIPRDWARFRATDFGQTKENGTATVWFAVGDDGTRYLYREYYLAGEASFPVHAANVRALQPRDEDELIEGAVGDPASKEGRAAFAAAGMPCGLGSNDVQGGISRLAELMRCVGGRPRLKVFTTCVQFVAEVESYRRDANRRDGAPLKKNDHLLDAARYGEALIAAWHAL